MLKNKRFILVLSAIVFLIVVFFLKNGFGSKNGSDNNALSYNNSINGQLTLQDLVNQDSDGDGVLDWEENLWGTDPAKKDTDDDGISDEVEVSIIKSETAVNIDMDGGSSLNIAETQTDKFSKEFFATVAVLNQSGSMDEATIDKLSTSLADSIGNSVQRKIYKASDIKTTADESIEATKSYESALNDIYRKYKIENNILAVLEKFMIDENNVDVDALLELTPIVKQIEARASAMTKIKVPQYLLLPHLDLVNTLQRLSENLKDIQLYDTDVIVALGAMGQYEENVSSLEISIINLENAIKDSQPN